MLVELIKTLTKIKKKHGNIPILYVYDGLSEMTIVNLTHSYLVYTDIDIHSELVSISASEYKNSNFISEKMYDAEIHKEFKPVVIITEKI